MEIIISKPFNYCFQYNIEQVFKCYNCYKITSYLKKKGLLEGLNYTLEDSSFSENEILTRNQETYIIREYPCGKWKLRAVMTQNTDTFKEFKYIFLKKNGVQFKSVYNLVFSFYENSHTYSTFFSLNLECSKDISNWISEYFSRFPYSWHNKICGDYEKYLSNWCKPEILMESVLINANIDWLYSQIINGSIFLKLPFFKKFSLVVEKKNGFVGSTYSFIKKEEKIKYTLHSIEEYPEFISLVFKKTGSKILLDKEIQFIIFKLNQSLSILNYFSKLKFLVPTRFFATFQKNHKKNILEIKKIFEE